MHRRHAEENSTAQQGMTSRHKLGEGVVLGELRQALGLHRLEPSDNFFQSGTSCLLRHEMLRTVLLPFSYAVRRWDRNGMEACTYHCHNR